jgi:hypothetical protein
MGFGIERLETRKMQDNTALDHEFGHSIGGVPPQVALARRELR